MCKGAFGVQISYQVAIVVSGLNTPARYKLIKRKIMNADLNGMKRYYEKRIIPNGLIVYDDGTPLTSKQAHALIEWGVKNGYTDLYSMPDFKDIK